MNPALRDIAVPIERYSVPDELIEAIGDARVVMLGEATHGTSEFYSMRAAISERLIAEHGFCAVALEADWPDAHRVARYCSGDRNDPDAETALGDFERFPAWMWRNLEFVEFVEWLRAHNAEAQSRCAVFGMDLYSLNRSMNAVIGYLERKSPALAHRARERYACFDPSGGRGDVYGYQAAFDYDEGCRAAAEAQFEEMQQLANRLAQAEGRASEDAYFYAEQNALLVRNAELYYRSMYSGRIDSWNVRDTHMADTIERLLEFLSRRSSDPKVIVWAHNSHLGDASATEMGERGELNVGQLVRLRHHSRAFSLGFTTYDGTVMAANDWNGPHAVRSVRPALPESYEALFHETLGGRDALLILRDSPEDIESFLDHREQRAIGVIYRPRTERQSHYFRARIRKQFDAVIHFDHTRHVQPLDKVEVITGEIAPETFPTSL